MATPLLPSTLPLLPLPPPTVLFPHMRASIPLSSAQLATVFEGIHLNAQHHKAEDKEEGRVVAVVPVVEIERRVGRWACAGRIKAIEKSKEEDDLYFLVVEGMTRIRLPRSLPPVLSVLPSVPLPISPYSLPLPFSSQSTISLLPLALRLLPSQLHSRLAAVPPSLLADLLITVLGASWEIKVELLGIPDLETRTSRVRDIMIEIMASRGLPLPKDNDPSTPNKSLPRPPSSISTALIPRPRNTLLPAPSKPIEPHIPEDLIPLHDLLARRQSHLTKPAATSINRELARLNKIPPQSAEYNVSKTYVEWLLALPWNKVSEKGMDINLEEARKRLDAEHEGLEGVKRRVVEYLAVYRLKRQLFHEEQAAKQSIAPPHHKEEGKEVFKSTAKIVDPDVAKDLLELIPNDERKAIEETTSSLDEDMDDGPPQDVYRDKGPILLLVGAPGVGKTSIARSLASSLGRKFHRISLGGVRDEAEIRGHRRTYVGALPGLLVQALRRVGVSNPLILLDELDKIGHSSHHGDPAAALLEALDPAQNWNFHDHYLGDVSIDLSQVLFVATANDVNTISWPLYDRCEVIECAGYVTPEKLAIAKRFLLPRQIKECGLREEHVQVGDEVLLRVITEYTRESGVRSLERELGKLCRTKAVEYSATREKGKDDTVKVNKYDSLISVNDVEKILGIAKYPQDEREELARPGVVNGLAYSGSGMGGVMLIETLIVPGGHGKLVMTGHLGDVFCESVELCLTWVKSRAMSLGIVASAEDDPLRGMDIHFHAPEGAVSKNGPSAGLATVLALVSLLTGKPVPSDLAVTGEMSLRGTLIRIGGVKEKVLGAHRSGIKKVMLPKGNLKDVAADLPQSVKDDIHFVYANTIEEALEEVWGKGVWVNPDSSKGASTGASVNVARL